MPGCTVHYLKTLLVYSSSFEVDWLHERCGGWNPYNAATRKLSPIAPRSVRRQKRAADGSFISSKVGEVPVRFREPKFMRISEARSAAVTASAQIYETVPPHPINVSAGRDNRGTAPTKQIRNLQDFSDQSIREVSALCQVQLHCEKAGLYVPTIVLEAQKPTVQWLVAIPEN